MRPMHGKMDCKRAMHELARVSHAYTTLSTAMRIADSDWFQWQWTESVLSFLISEGGDAVALHWPWLWLIVYNVP